jgi:phospholipid/cholesterol/gamma-HCH transport system substrate-binding protein
MSEPRIHPERIGRTPQRELVLGLLVVLGVALVAVLSTAAINGSPVASPYELRVALAPDGPILRPGADVRIAGTRAGTVRAVKLDGSGRRAEARVELPGERAGRGASARVRLRGLAGVVYLELDPGDRAAPLASGSRIGPARTSAGTQLTDVVAGFDADARRALGHTLDVYGGGLRGRGPALNRTLATLPALLPRATRQLRALTRRRGELGALLDDLGAVAGAAADGGLEGALGGASGTLRRTGARAGELRAALAALPGVEDEAARTLGPVDGLLGRATRTATALRPALVALADALPALRDAEHRRAGIDELATLARDARPAVGEATPLIRELKGAAVSLGPVAQPLASLGRDLVPYSRELVEAPAGFSRWGGFTYPFGTGAGHRAVRFSLVLTCAGGRRPYPQPGEAATDARRCG